MMNLAGVWLLRFIGSLQESAAAQAAYAVGYTELFSLITWSSVGLMGATSALVGQNLGAGKPERSVLAVHTASKIGLTLAAAIGALFMLIPQRLLSLFGMVEANVVGIGAELLQYLSLSGLFITVALVYTGGLQGAGDTRSPLYITLISQIVIPLGMCGVLQSTRGLQPAAIWLAIVISGMRRVAHCRRCDSGKENGGQSKWRSARRESYYTIATSCCQIFPHGSAFESTFSVV